MKAAETTSLRRRFWAELGLAVISLLFASLTLISKDWIEIIFKVDPDQHSGSLEWSLLAISLTATVAAGVLAYREWRRARLHTAHST